MQKLQTHSNNWRVFTNSPWVKINRICKVTIKSGLWGNFKLLGRQRWSWKLGQKWWSCFGPPKTSRADVGNTSERISLRNDGVSWLKGSRGRIPFSSPKPDSLLQPYQGKGELMDLGVLASETILETETALCINTGMGKAAVLTLWAELWVVIAVSGSDKQKRPKDWLKCH